MSKSAFVVTVGAFALLVTGRGHSTSSGLNPKTSNEVNFGTLCFWNPAERLSYRRIEKSIDISVTVLPERLLRSGQDYPLMHEFL